MTAMPCYQCIMNTLKDLDAQCADGYVQLLIRMQATVLTLQVLRIIPLPKTAVRGSPTHRKEAFMGVATTKFHGEKKITGG